MYSNEPQARAARTLKNTCLGLLAQLGEPAVDAQALARFEAADNMTDQVASLAALVGRDCPQRTQALGLYYEQWKHDPLIMNKWLGLQAAAPIKGNVENVKALTQHPAFDIKNPNKVGRCRLTLSNPS